MLTKLLFLLALNPVAADDKGACEGFARLLESAPHSFSYDVARLGERNYRVEISIPKVEVRDCTYEPPSAGKNGGGDLGSFLFRVKDGHGVTVSYRNTATKALEFGSESDAFEVTQQRSALLFTLRSASTVVLGHHVEGFAVSTGTALGYGVEVLAYAGGAEPHRFWVRPQQVHAHR